MFNVIVVVFTIVIDAAASLLNIDIVTDFRHRRVRPQLGLLQQPRLLYKHCRFVRVQL